MKGVKRVEEKRKKRKGVKGVDEKRKKRKRRRV